MHRSVGFPVMILATLVLFFPHLTKRLHALEPSGGIHFGHYSDSSIAILFIKAWRDFLL